MITVQLTASFKGLPTGATLSVESLSSLDLFSARGFFDLNLSDGRTLPFMDVFADIDIVDGDLFSEIRNASPSA